MLSFEKPDIVLVKYSPLKLPTTAKNAQGRLAATATQSLERLLEGSSMPGEERTDGQDLSPGRRTQ